MKEQNGDLLPLNGEDGNQQENADLAKAEANNLHQEIEDGRSLQEENSAESLHKEEEIGCLLPLSGDEEAVSNNPQHEEEQDEGVLPPQRGDAATKGLQPIEKGHVKEDEANEEGKCQPAIARSDDGGKFQPAHDDDDDGALRPPIGALYNGEFFPTLVDFLQIGVMHAWKPLLFTYMHAVIGRLGKALTVYDYLVIDFAKPRVDPKVKKKTSLLLCLTIHTPFHPGEHGHDGNPPSRHHEPCSSFCLYLESSTPSPHSYPDPPSPSAFSIYASLSVATQDDKPRTSSIPFTPLRGREGYQAHERNYKLKNPHAASKTMVMKMRLFSINKDLLDPG